MPLALDRHIALIGPAGAGKTLGAELAGRIERPFYDLHGESEQPAHRSLADIFRRDSETDVGAGEALMRLRERPPSVIALEGRVGGSPEVGEALSDNAMTVLVDGDLDERFRADLRTTDLDDVVLAALGIRIEEGARPEGGALIADPHVLELHSLELSETHTVYEKSIEEARRLWADLGISREGRIVGYGGGTTTDLAGFVAATYRRGVPWSAVPTTLVGQVDAAIGGKVGVDLREGKALAGAFHYPEEVLIDPTLLSTLPEEERRAGMAEVVKAGLLAGRELWELPERELVRAAAAFKAEVCLVDPYERGRRAILGLGHTFAHALEAASLYTVRHGDAVALGLLAALRLSGLSTDVVESVLDPRPLPVNREDAWAALKREQGAPGGGITLVLLEEPGRPIWNIERPEAEVRSALDTLIA